jgi:transposase-like protein
VQRYAPEIEQRLRSRPKATTDSSRVDETYIRVKGKRVYLYRAVDSTGGTLDFLLSAKQDAAAAKRFLAKALGRQNHPSRASSTPTVTARTRLQSCGSKPKAPRTKTVGARRCRA